MGKTEQPGGLVFASEYGEESRVRAPKALPSKARRRAALVEELM